MTHRNENSVLFSLGHLQQLAMATSANRQTTFGPPRPMYQQQQAVEPLPVTFSPSAAVLAPRVGWPSWLAPMVIGIGVLFIGFLVLALVVAMRPAEVRQVPKPTTVSKAAVTPTPAPAPVAAVAQPTPPKPEATATPSALPAKLPAAEKVVEKPVADPPAKQKKLTKSKRKRLAKARLKRRRLRRKRRRTKARARRAKRRTKRIATRSKRSSKYKPFGKLGDRDLDAILNAAGR